MEFEWDLDKAAVNLAKHGVAFTEAMTIFGDPLELTISTQIIPIHVDDSDEMRPEYDFSGGVRGKHVQAYRAGTNVVFLEPDLVAAFPDSASVNHALRLLIRLAQSKGVAGGRAEKPRRATSHPGRKPGLGQLAAERSTFQCCERPRYRAIRSLSRNPRPACFDLARYCKEFLDTCTNGGFRGHDGSQQTPFFRGLLRSASIKLCLRTRRPQVRVLQGAPLLLLRPASRPGEPEAVAGNLC